MGTVTYPLTDRELADLSLAYGAEKVKLTKRSLLKNGNETFYLTDGSWNYTVVVDRSGDWTWGFKSEA